MLTLHKRRLASLTTLTGLSIFSAGMALADTDVDVDVVSPDAGSYRPEQHVDRMSCSDALQLAWFKRQVEMTDGGEPADESLAPAPSECERDIVAGASDVG
jgi:hypothetical protein